MALQQHVNQIQGGDRTHEFGTVQVGIHPQGRLVLVATGFEARHYGKPDVAPFEASTNAFQANEFGSAGGVFLQAPAQLLVAGVVIEVLRDHNFSVAVAIGASIVAPLPFRNTEPETACVIQWPIRLPRCGRPYIKVIYDTRCTAGGPGCPGRH
jgi:hypothetical protein